VHNFVKRYLCLISYERTFKLFPFLRYISFILLISFLFVAIGSKPNTELARVAGLEIDEVNGGIVTNSFFQATPNVWAV
jgi:hypothetical protein